MKEIYDSHILTYSGCTIKDGQALRQIAANFRPTEVKIIPPSKDELSFNQLSDEVLMSVDSPFSVKFVKRSPGKTLEDTRDEHGLATVGGPATGRTPPFFFRHDGSAVDLLGMYHGQSAFLCVNGKSLADVDLSLLKMPGVFTMSVNNGGHVIRPNFWMCVDDPHRFMPSIWIDPKITKIVPAAHFQKRLLAPDNTVSGRTVAECPAVVGFRRNERFNPDTFLTEPTINWGNHGSLGGGRSVMIAAMRVLHLLGFRTIYLVGCDFYMDENNRYFFEEGRDKNAISNNMSSYRIMTGFFASLVPVFEKAGMKVFNLNPKSELKVFPFMPFEEAIVRATSEILPELKRSTNGMYVKR